MPNGTQPLLTRMLGQSDDHAAEQAIPVHVVCKRILDTPDLDRDKLERIFHEWLVAVELTPSEHRILQKGGLASRMPHDWDGADPFARYRAAGIRFLRIRPRRG